MALVTQDLEAAGGEILFCGATDWNLVGRHTKKTEGNEKQERALKFPQLLGPHRLAALKDVSITRIAAGSASCFCVALDIEGQCYTWGRNEGGQLGHGDVKMRQSPTKVEGFGKQVAVRIAGGKNHTVLVMDNGNSYAWGSNQYGQLGTGSLKNDQELSPVPTLVQNATDVACGADFTMWLTSSEKASIMSAGLPQYGQLGHGTDNEYNAKEGSVKLVHEPQPTPRAISGLAHTTIRLVACGHNHTVAVTSEGFVYTWGFGGYGRLGHRVQKDEWKPRKVEEFQKRNVVPPNGVCAAGAGFSACTGGGGQMYMWGKVKNTGDSWMYPKALMDLSGWNIRCMDSGNMSSAVAADESLITWGTSLYGELGFGPSGPKSSSIPKKVDDLEGTHVIRVACGVGHSMFVVSRDKKPEVLDKLPVFEPTEDVDDEEESEEEGEGDEEEEEEDEDEEETKAGSKRKGRGRGRGGAGSAKRGRGSKKAAPVKKGGEEVTEKPARGRGRGRPRGGGRGKK